MPELQKCFQTRKKPFPIWLNADILAGPGARSETPVDKDYFIVESAKFPQVVISVGWITLTDPEEPGYVNQLSLGMLKLMLQHDINNN